MNVITFDCAYSLYPMATFEDRISLWMPGNPSYMTASRLLVLNKYSRRGWSFIHEVLPNRRHLFQLGQPRHLNDKDAWALPLDTEGVEPKAPLSPTSPSFGWDPVVENSWSLARADGMLFMRYTFLKSFCLRYTYMLARSVHVNGVIEYYKKQEILEKNKLAIELTEGTGTPVMHTW